ncbi:MAG: hypothetical protein ACOX6P_02385 [Candidatus Merdivicinus sp.]|jgi:hypothetical protein
MKRKVMLVAVAVILCSLIAMGGTLAFETISGRNTNQVSTGKIAITLHEEYEKQENLVPNPNKLIEKEVWVESDASAGDAYVRVQVKKEWISAGAFPGEPLTTDNIKLNVSENWQYLDGYYYYKEPLKAGSKTVPLMDGFYFMPLSDVDYEGALTDNDYKGLTAKIDVQAFAVQAANSAMEYEWNVRYDAETKTFEKIETTDPVEPDVEA